MNKHERLTKFIISASLICGTVATLAMSSTNMLLTTFALENATTWTLDANDSPTVETKVKHAEKTYDSHTTYGFDNVGYYADGLCTLYEGGRIQKTNDGGATYGLQSISATFTGSLKLVSMYEKTDATYFTYTLESGIRQTIEGNYFYLEALEDTQLASFTVNYGCVASAASVAPSPSNSLKLTFTKDNYATLEKIDGVPYFVLRGTYNETPMNKSFSIFHDDNTYIINAEKTIVYTQTQECDVYFNFLSTPSIFEDKLTTYYPHISCNGQFGNNLVYRILDDKQVAPTLTTIAYNDFIIETKFPNLAGGMVSINLYHSDNMTPYKFYNLTALSEGKVPSTRLIERERFASYLGGSGYGKGIEYYNGYYYSVRSMSNNFYIDKISFNGSWKLEASSTPIDIDYGNNPDVGRIFAYNGKIYTFDYSAITDPDTSFAPVKLIAFDADTLEKVDDSEVTLSFGGIAENEKLILSASYSKELKTFVVLALSDHKSFITSSANTAHIYIYDEDNLEQPRKTINVTSTSHAIRDVAIYKNVAEVLTSANNGGIIVQDFTIAKGKEAWQQNYTLDARVGIAKNSSYNHQGIAFNDKGQLVLSSASWGGLESNYSIQIFEPGDNVANDSLYNHLIYKQHNSTATIEKSFVKGAIEYTDYVCQQSVAVTDDNRVYFLMDVASNVKGRVQEIDITTGEFIGVQSPELSFASANQFTAPSNAISYFDGHLYAFGINGKIYKFANDAEGNVNLSSVSEVENPFTDIPEGSRIYNVSVDREGRYCVSVVTGTSATSTVRVYNSNKEFVHEFTVKSNGSFQSIFGTKDYLYVNGSSDSNTSTWPQSTVDVYTYNGTKLYSTVFSNLGLEDGSDRTIECLANCPSYFEVNGAAYLTVNTWKYNGSKQVFDIYKFAFTDSAAA